MTGGSKYTFFFLAFAVLTGPLAGAVSAQEGNATKWLTVQVQNPGGEDVDIQLPLVLHDLVQKVVDFERLSKQTNKEADIPVQVITKVLNELSQAPPQEVLTVEAEGTTVKVATESRKPSVTAKTTSTLRVSVKNLGNDGENVKVAIPLGIVELVAQSLKNGMMTEEHFTALGVGPDETCLHLNVLVSELPKVISSIREAGPVDLVCVRSEREEVRVWTE